MPTCNHCGKSMNEFAEMPFCSGALPEHLQINFMQHSRMPTSARQDLFDIHDHLNQSSPVAKIESYSLPHPKYIRSDLRPLQDALNKLWDLVDSDRKYSKEMREFLQEIGFIERNVRWVKREGDEPHILVTAYCDLCGTIQRMFFKGYQEEHEQISDNIKENEKLITELEQSLVIIEMHLDNLRVEDKKVRALAKKKAMEDERKAEISELKGRLAELTNGDE